jgi:hypothetical protein
MHFKYLSVLLLMALRMTSRADAQLKQLSEKREFFDIHYVSAVDVGKCLNTHSLTFSILAEAM